MNFVKSGTPCLNPDWRYRFLGCGEGGNLLMGIGKSQNHMPTPNNKSPSYFPFSSASWHCPLRAIPTGPKQTKTTQYQQQQ